MTTSNLSIQISETRSICLYETKREERRFERDISIMSISTLKREIHPSHKSPDLYEG